MRSAVIGGGSWGTALATVLANRGDVCIWAREPDVVEGINREHRNVRYQKDAALPRTSGRRWIWPRPCTAPRW
jgi:glycerol-3-phosphate dehydrogenase (NAD(P)+)